MTSVHLSAGSGCNGHHVAATLQVLLNTGIPGHIMHSPPTTCVEYHSFMTLAKQETSCAYSLILGCMWFTQAAIFGWSCGDQQRFEAVLAACSMLSVHLQAGDLYSELHRAKTMMRPVIQLLHIDLYSCYI